ncbi:MAG TPA: SPOR domain-containing protein [Steroidobacteraceae bacterium]
MNLVGWIPIVDVQAKDRLTGAVILVVLLVLVVPELLSGPERKVAAATAERSDEPPLRSYTVDLGDDAHTRRAPASDPATAAAPLGAAPAAAVTTPAASAPMAVAAVPPVHAPTPVTAPPVATTRPAAAAPVTATRSVAPAPMQESVKAAAVVAHPAPPATAGGGWTVQLGSFASRANAERLVLDLKAKGYAAFSTESGSGGRKLYRVRVGPPEDHASAEALGAKLRSAGHPGTLTQRP